MTRYARQSICPKRPLAVTMNEQTIPSLSIAAAQLIEAACRARKGDRNAARAYITQALARLDGQLCTVQPSPATPSPEEIQLRHGGFALWQARRVVAHIDAHLEEQIQICELARLLGVSRFHFCRVFKLTFGVPTRTWILRRRIEAAQALMLTTDEKLSAIGLRCGMSDQPHFTRMFRRLVGETPYSWRRTRREAMLDHECETSGGKRLHETPLRREELRLRTSRPMLTVVSRHDFTDERIDRNRAGTESDQGESKARPVKMEVGPALRNDQLDHARHQ
jgi:AraC family transcriptional regulator